MTKIASKIHEVRINIFGQITSVPWRYRDLFFEILFILSENKTLFGENFNPSW